MTFLDWRERWFSTELQNRLRTGARRHWLFLAVLGAGLTLRVITQITYRPALLFIDSYRYLANINDLSPTANSQPIGYTLFFLRPVLSVGNLAASGHGGGSPCSQPSRSCSTATSCRSSRTSCRRRCSRG
jgi:hypothetical protein